MQAFMTRRSPRSAKVDPAEQLRNPCSPLSQQRIAEVNAFIDDRLDKFIKPNDAFMGGSEIAIYNECKPKFTNGFRDFFKIFPDKKKFMPGHCEICFATRSDGVELERAHTTSRPLLAMKAIHTLKQKSPTISMNDLMRTYILQHRDLPLWILCSSCHRSFDSKKK